MHGVSIQREFDVLLHPKVCCMIWCFSETHFRMFTGFLFQFFAATDHQSIATSILCYGPAEVPNTNRRELFFIISPDVGECDLFSTICTNQAPIVESFDINSARCIFKMIAEGANYMHQHGLCHRDLKLENVVVMRDLTVKIIDFGSAKFTVSCDALSSGECFVCTVCKLISWSNGSLCGRCASHKLIVFDNAIV